MLLLAAYNTSTISSIVHFSVIFGSKILDPTGSRNGCLHALPDLYACNACHACSGHVQGSTEIADITEMADVVGRLLVETIWDKHWS